MSRKTRENFRERKDQRRKDALTRQEDWSSLTPQQQLTELDNRLGKDQGAAKQRKRLQKKIATA